jgi:hypothetical protein
MRTRWTLLPSGLLALGLFVTACSERTPEEQRAETDERLNEIEATADDANAASTQREWIVERDELLTGLRKLRDDIDDQLVKRNKRLADTDLKPSERKDEEALKAELEREKNKVDALIRDVENANEENWATIKLDTRKGADDLRTWWQKFKEDIDRGTKADADKDGH